MAGGSLKKVFGMSTKPRPLFCCEKMPEMAQGDARAVAVASYRRECKGAGVFLMIVGSSARVVRGRGEGAAHDSRRQGAAMRGAWRRPGRHGRRAAMASSYGHWWRVLLVVRIGNESAASRCPSWRQVVPGGGRILPGISPHVGLSWGSFRRRGRPFV